jgi:hypothetical protein
MRAVSESIPGDPDRDTGEGDERASGAERSNYDLIAKRAYEIYESGEGGTPQENWERAERELQGEATAS